jgi:hypothetical protein
MSADRDLLALQRHAALAGDVRLLELITRMLDSASVARQVCATLCGQLGLSAPPADNDQS